MSTTEKIVKSIMISVLFLILVSSNSIAQYYNDSTNSKNSNPTGNDQIGMFQKQATDLTSDLKSQLNLTDSQVSAVKSDLIDYMTTVSTIQNSQRAGLKEKYPTETPSIDSSSDNYSVQMKNAETDTNTKIESVITEDQKAKWMDVKDSWWQKVKSEVNNSMMK